VVVLDEGVGDGGDEVRDGGDEVVREMGNEDRMEQKKLGLVTGFIYKVVRFF
jgi:hypothetical protein